MKKKVTLVTGLVFLAFALFSLSGCLTASVFASQSDNPFTEDGSNTDGALFRFTISSNVKDAHIYIDGNFVGNNEISTFYRSKTYQVVIKAKGYEKWEEMVILDAARTIFAELVPLEE